MTARVYMIDGKPMTFAEIRKACPDVKLWTLHDRVVRWGWRKLTDLRAPPLPGRKSPWRAWAPGQFRKNGGRLHDR